MQSEGGKSVTQLRIEAEDEELKYLDFINEVTNDILTQGIYSDRYDLASYRMDASLKT